MTTATRIARSPQALRRRVTELARDAKLHRAERRRVRARRAEVAAYLDRAPAVGRALEELGQTLFDKLQAAPDFEPVHEPQCNIVAFRYVPEAMREAPPEELGRFQLELRRALIESGSFYLVPTKADGVGALRVTLINPFTTESDLADLLAAVRSAGEADV